MINSVFVLFTIYSLLLEYILNFNFNNNIIELHAIIQLCFVIKLLSLTLNDNDVDFNTIIGNFSKTI